MAVILITSGFAGPALADTGVDEADPADEVFVAEDGDAVLVYEDDDEAADDATGEFGLDVGESVAYALVTDDMEDDISAAFSMGVDGDGVESSGSLVADRPAEIDDFSMDVTGEQTQAVNEFDAELDLVLDTQEVPEADFVQSASSSGELVTSADEFTTRGEFSVTHIMPADGPDTGLELEITETDGSYTIDVKQQKELLEFETEEWRTEDSAEASLDAEFGEVARELGGDATVTIDAHEFEEDAAGGGYLDVAYTIELENVKGGLERAVADELANDPELELTTADAEQVASDLLDAELDAFELSYLDSENTITGDWHVAFSGYDSTVTAMFDLMEAAGEMDDEFADEFDDYAEMYEAQAEADLTQTAEWDVTFAPNGAHQAALSIDYTSETENWEAYTAALEERDIDSPEFTIDAHAETVDDEIEMEMALEISQEDLLESAVAALVEDLQNDPNADDEALEFLTAFDEAELELAKFDLDMDDGTATMEMGATFDDMSAFEGHLADAYHGLTVEHVYGDSDEEAVYVYVTDMAGADATEDDVREHSIVDDETTVHLPGEWDEDHPRLDMQQVTNYLGLETSESETESTEEGDDGLPGFGAAAALVALLSTMLWARFQ